MNLKNELKKVRNFFVPSKVIHISVSTSSPNDLLRGEVILITGGATGIGKSVAEYAARQGAKAIIIGRRREKLEEACDFIGNDTCRFLEFDITKSVEYQEFFNKAEKIFDMPVTGLVNNAGIYIQKGMMDFSVADYDNIFNVNLKAPLFLMREYVRYCMVKKIAGNLVVTASNRGLYGDVGPYGISKAAIGNYVEGMARDLIGTGIRVNAVAPGMTASEINHIDVEGNMYTSSAKGERVLLPDEIAEVICFLLSNNSKCITGAIIPCDEGDRLR